MTEIVLWDVDGTLVTYRNPNRERFTDVIKTVTGQSVSFGERELVGATDSGILDRGLTQAQDGDSAWAGVNSEVLPVLVRTLDLEMRKSLAKGGQAYEPCAGALSTIQALQYENVYQTIVTGNSFYRAIEKLSQASLVSEFDPAWGAYGDEATERSGVLRLALARASIRSREPLGEIRAVLVGDSPADAKAAKECGINCVLVASGNYSRVELIQHNASRTLESLENSASVILEVLRSN